MIPSYSLDNLMINVVRRLSRAHDALFLKVVSGVGMFTPFPLVLPLPLVLDLACDDGGRRVALIQLS